MLSSVLKGITTAMLVTVLTLLGGVVWEAIGFGGWNISSLLDIGLLASCIIGGYRTAKETGEWLTGGITGAGYVTVGTSLLALFLPIRVWGFIQVLGEGIIIGLVAGAVGAGRPKGKGSGSWPGRKAQAGYRPYYAGYGSGERTTDFDWETEDNLSKNQEKQGNAFGDDFDFGVTESELNSGTKDFETVPEVEWPWDDNYGKFNKAEIQEEEPVKFEEAAKVSEDSKANEGKPWWE
ncbi:hypothetical protein REC12_09650 [Desulfosporosinus sp. PR]|uniref:hypothetical protein n=1 Tax=Candidatus Desulfosporosinus nitrosoreducens TaxID=3401928 RepID=UPI0027FC44F9|nr:hypothetical protein [Desulfosporosinus sp. PR]MDQ7093856.1 hypothetical protein [Desulfosporosinus sp. PR]